MFNDCIKNILRKCLNFENTCSSHPSLRAHLRIWVISVDCNELCHSCQLVCRGSNYRCGWLGDCTVHAQWTQTQGNHLSGKTAFPARHSSKSVHSETGCIPMTMHRQTMWLSLFVVLWRAYTGSALPLDDNDEIANGDVVDDPAELSFLCRMHLNGWSKSHFCGATLISPDFAVTAN